MDLVGANVLVTGGAGFIGSHLVDALVDIGARVTVIDSLQAGNPDNLARSRPKIRFLRGDVRDYSNVREAVDGQQVIFHLAANASVPISVSDYRYDFDTNAAGTFNVLRAAMEARVAKVLFASSAAVYGTPQYVPVDESHPLLPISPYGATKLVGETLGFVYGRTFDLDFSCVRIFNSFGIRQARYVIYDLLGKLRRDPTTLEVLGDGTQIRDYCYVSDTVRALLLVAQSDRSRGNVYNLAGGNPISIRDLVALLIDVLGLPEVRVHYTGQSWKGDIDRLIANTAKLRELGFSPTISLREGIVTMAEWFYGTRPNVDSSRPNG
jgi:UDP-glucose 4-epimerase